MDIKPYANQSRQSDGPSSVTAELYFLIARLLSHGPCQNASEALQRELEMHGLLPKRIDWLGNEHDQTYAQVCQSFSHVGPNHLLELCRRLGPLVDKEVPTNVQGVHSLLGAGRQSILRRKEDIIRKLHRDHYVVRQNKRPRLFPHDIVHPPNNVPLLLGREFTGAIDTQSATPAKLYSRVQLFCRTLGHLSAVYCVLFDRTGQYIFTGADDLLIKIWSVVTGRLLATLRGASAEIADLAVSCDNSLLAAGSCDKIVRVWCLRTTAPIAVLTGHGGTITSINFCPADRGSVRYLASTSSDGSVSFWEYVTEPGQTPKFFPRPHKFNEKIRPGQAQMLCASFSPGGSFMATGCADHHVRVYAMFGQEGPERILEQEAHSDRVDSIQWANTGLRFISGSKDGSALIWRYEKQEWRTVRLRMSCRLEGASTATAEELSQKLKVTMVTWSRDDRYLITAVSDFSIKIWDSSTGILHKELRGHEGEAFVLEPHPFDPNVLLSAGHDGRLLIWDMAKGEVMKSFLNFIDGQGHGAVFDAKWNPSGSTIAATDSHGHLSIYGIGPSESFKKLPKAIFFHTDYRPLIRDAHHHVLDEQTQLAPHLMPPPFLVDSEGNPYPPIMQRLVPGRENLKDDQLVPTVVVNANGEQEILAGVEVLPPPGDEVPNNPPAVVTPPQPTPQRTRSNIDQMIAELAQQQERQRNRPRSSTTAAVAAAAVPSTSTAPPNSDHSYTSRTPHTAHSRPLLVASGSGNSPRASVTPEPEPGEVADEAPEDDDSVNLSTEATASESLPGFSRRVIVKPLTIGQLISIKNERQGCADEEVTLFYQEVQRKSPNIFLNTSVSPGITALLAARSRGVSDDGWSPSRPRRAHSSRPPRTYQRERNVVSSPARSRMPPVSPARRTSAAVMAPPQPNNQHNYRTRANRTTNGTRERVREGASDGTRERSRRVVRRVVSTDEDEQVDVEVEERRSSRRTSPRDNDTGDEEETRQTRSNARRQQPRDGDALSTSDSDDSESESDLASDLLDSDESDSETRGSSSSSSSEYSDWTAEAGVNLEPPKRTRKKVYRRPRCLSSEEETAAPSTSAQPANEAEEGEGSQPGPKKRRGPIPKAGSGGLDRIPESFRPSEWLSSVVPRRQPFYPQMGDEVIYFRQGHEQYVDAINLKKLFELNPRSLPWSSQTIREQELVKIIGIKYEIKPPRLCCLKLGLMDPATGVLTGESFILKYHDVADVLDFLVLKQNYDLAIQRNWQPGDRFRSIIDDLWWEGQLETREPYQAQCPDSMFLCYRIRWDNDEVDRVSPWDLEKIDLERRPTGPGTGVPVIPSEIAMTLYQPRAEDWPPGGDRDSECDRISAGLSQVMGLAIAEPFVAPVDLNLYPSYAYVVEYPMDLSTIKARLENRFYRRVTAVQYDVRYVYTNACKFNEPKSDIVRSASIISDLCLEIIRNRDSVDATALYHQLVEKYKIRDEGADENAAGAGPSKSGGGTKRNGSAPNTPNTRSRSRRNSQHTDSESEDTSSKTKSRNGTENGKSKEKRINTRIAKAAALSWKQQCNDLIDTLCQSEDAGPFREPVSILDVPDYLQVIDHPMDLGTVREQLQVSNYATPMDFAKDVRLIFENSKKYNTLKKSRIFAMTVRLSASFEEHIRGILASYKHRKSSDRSSKSPHSHSKSAKSSKKGKSLAPSRSTRSIKVASEVELPRENIKIVLSRVNKGQIVVQPSTSSQPGDSGVGGARRRILEEDEPSASSTSAIPNGNSVVSEDIEAKPGPSGLSASTSLPATNGLGKRGLKRRIVSDDDYEEDEDEDGHDVSLNVPGVDEESLEPPDLTKSQEDLTKGKALKRRDAAPPVLKAIKEESSSEDEKPISQRRRMPMAKVSVTMIKEEDARPSSSSSNNSSISKNNSSNSGSLCEDGSSLRRSGRARRKPKRPLDSEPSENEDRAPALADGRKNPRGAVRTRNGGKRTVRYREDSEDEAKKRNSRQSVETKGGSSSRLARKTNSDDDHDDDDDDHENEDPSVKQQQNGSVKRCSRQSAQEATKRLRTDFASSSEDEDVPSMPTYAMSSRGRLRKIINHSHQDSYSE